MEKKAKEAWFKPDYPAAIKHYEDARQELGKAKDFLQGLRSFPIKGLAEATETRAKEVEQQMAVMALHQEKARGAILLSEGRKYMRLGGVALVKAQKDSSSLAEAQKNFIRAATAFQSAKKHIGKEADEDWKAAQAASIRLEKLLQPLELDLAKAKNLEGWSMVKTQWRIHSADSTWLQGAEVPSATLTSPSTPFPADFDLTVDFSIVDRDGKIRNSFWTTYPDPLLIVLAGKNADSEDLVIGLGKDMAIKFDNLARIKVGKKSYSYLPGRDDPPITLRLVRYQGTGTLTVRDKEIASFPLTNDFHHITFKVANGKNRKGEWNAFAAIFKVSLKAYLKKTGKSDEQSHRPRHDPGHTAELESRHPKPYQGSPRRARESARMPGRFLDPSWSRF
jgi:hypothetical protein